MVEPILKWLTENPWANLIGLIVTILGVVLSVYFYITGRKRKIPVYSIRSFNLVSNRLNKVEEIKIAYNDKVIKNLSITKVAFWNSGNEVINKDDVAPKDPIRLAVSGESEILNVRRLFTKKDANNFELTISEDRKEIYIDFDYFYMNEGLTFEIFHTDTTAKNIQLKGSIKDAPAIASVDYNKDLIFDFLFNNTIGAMENKFNKKVFRVILVLIFPGVLFLMLLTAPVQLIYTLFKNRNIPKEYSLIN